MAIPGQQSYFPTLPATPPPPAGGGAPLPAPAPPAAGAGGNDWTSRLFGSTANIPDWLSGMMGRQTGVRRGGFKRNPRGGWMYDRGGADATVAAAAPIASFQPYQTDAGYFGRAAQPSAAPAAVTDGQSAAGWLQSYFDRRQS